VRERRGAYRVLEGGNLREKDPGRDGKIILSGSSGSWIGEHGSDSSDSG